jgi:hypothetical protein
MDEMTCLNVPDEKTSKFAIPSFRNLRSTVRKIIVYNKYSVLKLGCDEAKSSRSYTDYYYAFKHYVRARI